MPRSDPDYLLLAFVAMLSVATWYFLIKGLVTGEAEIRGGSPKKRTTAPVTYWAIILFYLVIAISAPAYMILYCLNRTP